MDLVKTFSALTGLASVKRYSMLPISTQESVLEHTGMVVVLCQFIAREIYPYGTPEYANLGDLAWRGVIHDFDELINGDTPRSTKYSNPQVREMFRDLEKKGMARVLSEMDVSPGLRTSAIERHTSAKEGTAGLILSIADTLCVVHRVWLEVLVKSNFAMIRHAESLQDVIKKLTEQVEVRFKDYDHGKEFLNALLGDADQLMKKAWSRHDPVHGAIREEMYS